MDREAWQATVQGVAKESDATEHTHITKVLRTLQTKKNFLGTSLVVQWLRLHTPNAGGPGSITGQGTRSCMP